MISPIAAGVAGAIIIREVGSSTVTFNWNAVANAQSYDVSLLRGGSVVTSTTVLTSASRSLTFNIMSGAVRHTIRVQATGTQVSTSREFTSGKTWG